jgi:hypothetical protein
MPSLGKMQTLLQIRLCLLRFSFFHFFSFCLLSVVDLFGDKGVHGNVYYDLVDINGMH